MSSVLKQLSGRSQVILQCIADGYSYEKILSLHSEFTYKNIFDAAQEALDILKVNAQKNTDDHIEKVRKQHPRAYEKWTEDEEALLIEMFENNVPFEDIASKLKRQTGAIRSRLRKLELIE
jgi:hypothetical protein